MQLQQHAAPNLGIRESARLGGGSCYAPGGRWQSGEGRVADRVRALGAFTRERRACVRSRSTGKSRSCGHVRPQGGREGGLFPGDGPFYFLCLDTLSSALGADAHLSFRSKLGRWATSLGGVKHTYHQRPLEQRKHI